MRPQARAERHRLGQRRLLHHTGHSGTRVCERRGHRQEERTRSRNYGAPSPHRHTAFQQRLRAAQPHHARQRPPGERQKELARARGDHHTARAHDARAGRAVSRQAQRDVVARRGVEHGGPRQPLRLGAPIRRRARAPRDPRARCVGQRRRVAMAPDLSAGTQPVIDHDHPCAGLRRRARRRDARRSAADHRHIARPHDALALCLRRPCSDVVRRCLHAQPIRAGDETRPLVRTSVHGHATLEAHAHAAYRRPRFARNRRAKLRNAGAEHRRRQRRPFGRHDRAAIHGNRHVARHDSASAATTRGMARAG